MTREHGVPAVPVFWIDAEDHDWDEVRQLAVLDAELRRATVAAAPPEGAGERPGRARCCWTTGIDRSARRALRDALPPTEFTDWLHRRRSRDAYRPGARHGRRVRRAGWKQVLGPHGLVVYDSSDPAAKPLVAHVFARELEHAGRTALAGRARRRGLAARGYHAQVTPHAGQRRAVPSRRRPAGRSAGDGDTFVVGDAAVPRRDARRRSAPHAPERFSPNVLLRPIVQDTLFPTICYVGGPNELAYLAQLRGVYEHFGIPMPLIVPRATATLVDSAALRFLTQVRRRRSKRCRRTTKRR